MQNKAHEEYKQLYIARAEEAAKYHNLTCVYEQHGTWITFIGVEIGLKELLSPNNILTPAVIVKARGWKNASDAFVAAVTTWAQQERAKSKQALKDALDEARLVGEAVDVDPDNWSTNY